MQTRKTYIKVVIGTFLSVFVLVGVSGVVSTQGPSGEKAHAQGVGNSSNVLGDSSASQGNNSSPANPAPRASSAAPTASAPKPVPTPPSTTTPAATPAPTAPAGTVEASTSGFLTGSVKTYVGGSACGFPGDTCEWPFATTVTIKDNSGNIVTSAPTSQDGSFNFTLKPGNYVVSVPDSGEVFIAPNPQNVTILPYETTTLNIFYQPMAMTNSVSS